MLKIMIVCTGNTCRSPMGEYLLRSMLSELDAADMVSVESAGIAAVNGSMASQGARVAMLERGIDISAHRSRMLMQSMVRQSDLILTMSEMHKFAIVSSMPEADSKVFTLAEYAGVKGDIADPHGGTLADYQESAKNIEEYLRKSLSNIVLLMKKHYNKE